MKQERLEKFALRFSSGVFILLALIFMIIEPLAGLPMIINALIILPSVHKMVISSKKIIFPKAVLVITFFVMLITSFTLLGKSIEEMEASRSPQDKAELALKEIKAGELKKLNSSDNKSLEILQLLYIEHVKEDAYFVKCKEAEFQSRVFYQCGVSYGNSDLAKKGLWEAAIGQNGNVILYAMNGNALRVLEKIGNSSEFASGTSRPSVDIEKVNTEF